MFVVGRVAVGVGASQALPMPRAFEELIGPREVGSESTVDGLFISVVTVTDATRSPVRETHVRVRRNAIALGGRWNRDGRTTKVVLERPHRPRGAIPNEFCGTWDEIDDEHVRPQVPGHPQPLNRLHVAESGDRQLTAWMDRPVVLGGRRYGERFSVITAANRWLEIEWVHPAGPSVRFAAQRSDDDAMMAGRWIRSADGRLGLTGPTTSFRRLQPPSPIGGCS